MARKTLASQLQEYSGSVPADVASLPGKAVERLTIGDGDPGETPLRGYEDLKLQYFGPSLLNKERLLEIGDTALYQGAYALPAGALGAYLGGPAGMFGGLAIGKLLGQGHLYSKEHERLEEARKSFSPKEKRLLKELSDSSLKWAIVSGLLAGLGTAGAAYAGGHDRFGKALTPVLEGGAAGTLAALLGGVAGHAAARSKARKDKQYRDIIRRYDRFS